MRQRSATACVECVTALCRCAATVLRPPAEPGPASGADGDEATVEVVVDEPGRLHERVHGRRADEAEAAPLAAPSRARSTPPSRPAARRSAIGRRAVRGGAKLQTSSERPPVELERRDRVADRRLDLAAMADDPRVARAAARRRARRTRRPARSRTPRTPRGTPRACAGSSATRARPGTPPARAARTARRRRAARSPTRRRGRRGRADRPRTSQQRAMPSSPITSSPIAPILPAAAGVGRVTARLQRAAWATMIAGVRGHPHEHSVPARPTTVVAPPVPNGAGGQPVIRVDRRLEDLRREGRQHHRHTRRAAAALGAPRQDRLCRRGPRRLASRSGRARCSSSWASPARASPPSSAR